jgi:oxygen-independent coproporphyrinogen-3 oxidase
MYYNEKYINGYLDALEREIKTRYQGEVINSIYIGGGTPTSLNYNELERLLNITKMFKISNEFEFTIESNIESLDDDKIRLLKKNKINRISLGVQSFNNKCLDILKRTHTKDDTIKIIKKLKDNKLTNINIDIIYGIIDDIDVVKSDIETFLKLDIPHISCYSLIIESNTNLSINNYHNIDEDKEYQQYQFIAGILKENNYNHYEISNYARDGYQSVHNLNYWNNGNYYGFGLSAVSFLDNNRITNTRNLNKYLKGDYLDEALPEDKDTRMSNTMILGLRKLEGVDIKDFYNKYQEDIVDVFDIDELLQERLVLQEGNYLKINPNYLYLSNEILLKFLERRS